MLQDSPEGICLPASGRRTGPERRKTEKNRFALKSMRKAMCQIEAFLHRTLGGRAEGASVADWAAAWID